jgi:hypothetical protein
MAANPFGNHAVTVRTAFGAAKVTATGATIAFVLAGTAAPAFAVQLPGKCASSLDRVSCTYNDPTVADYVLPIPLGVNEVSIQAHGAAGGDGGTVNPKVPAPQGGEGGFAGATFPVHNGELLHILVGGHGHDADGTKRGAGGRNGGGDGGAGAPGGGGGGGASSVRIDQPGGGGAGGAMTSTTVSNAAGGDGGGDRGADGGGDAFGQGGVGAVGPSGGAGLESTVGLDGHSGYDADNGGQGGEGGYGTATSLKHSGTWAGGPAGAGGGGAGWAGGSGGAAGATVGGGGGGGSGMVATSALAPTVARLGSITLEMGKGSIDDGEVVISYRNPLERHGKSAPNSFPEKPVIATADRQQLG